MKNNKKEIQIALIAILIVFNTGITAFAGQWRKSLSGWWYDNGNGTWVSNGWKWIQNSSIMFESCYYFDADGYCLMNTLTPDGKWVNESGAWVENGIVQEQLPEDIIEWFVDMYSNQKYDGYNSNIYTKKTEYDTTFVFEIYKKSGTKSELLEIVEARKSDGEIKDLVTNEIGWLGMKHAGELLRERGYLYSDVTAPDGCYLFYITNYNVKIEIDPVSWTGGIFDGDSDWLIEPIDIIELK